MYQFLSFVSDKTKKNVGACIVEANDIKEAVQIAWDKEINPGGQVMAFPLADLDDEDLELNRLYTPEELNAFNYQKISDV